MDHSLSTDVAVAIFMFAVPLFFVAWLVFACVQLARTITCWFIIVSAFLLVASVFIAAIASGAYDPNIQFVDVRNAPASESLSYIASAWFVQYCAMARGIETLVVGTQFIPRSFGC